jgi:hypothetical protein
MPTGLKSRRSLELVTLLTKRWGRNTLIRIRRLLDHHLLVRALARAAAYAERPEESRGDAEGDADPHDLQHLVTHGGVDVVGLERGVEDAGQDTVDAGCSCSGGDGEERRSLRLLVLYHGAVCWKTYTRQDGRDQTSPPREDSKEANHKLSSSQDGRNDKCPIHPASNLLVGVEALLEIVAKNILNRSVLQTPDLDGVEPELCLGGGAVCDLLDTILLFALAVGPQTDLIEVLELFG